MVSQNGSMRVRVVVAVIACLAAAGVSGCGHDVSCDVAGYGAGGACGYQTPQQAVPFASNTQAKSLCSITRRPSVC